MSNDSGLLLEGKSVKSAKETLILSSPSNEPGIRFASCLSWSIFDIRHILPGCGSPLHNTNCPNLSSLKFSGDGVSD